MIDADTVLADGAVLLWGGRVEAAGPARRLARRFGAVARDLGDVAIVPGLVNAHTHLELSALRGRLRPTADFAGWIGAQMRALATWRRADFLRSYRLGLRLALAAGTAAVGDICRRRSLLREALRGPLRAVIHLEIIEPDPSRADAAQREVLDVLCRAPLEPRMSRRPCHADLGLSPHAPYTVSGPLYRDLVRTARTLGRPLQTHLAETREEAELLRRGAGPLRDLLAGAGRPLPFAAPPGVSPVAHLDRLGVLRPPLVAVHCNRLTAADIETLARRRVGVVFCPRSHAFFRRPPHPLRRLLRAGVPVALGTDSLASNRDLDVRAEMREVVDRCGLAPREAWRMATERGARMLFGVRPAPPMPSPAVFRAPGTLRRGARADLTLLRAPGGTSPANAWERLLAPDARVAGVWVDGEAVRTAGAGDPLAEGSRQ